MNNLWLKSAVLASTALWSVAALAQSSASSSTVPASATPAMAGSSTAQAEVVEKKAPALPIGLGVNSTYYGPMLVSPGKHYGTTDSVNGTDPLYFLTQVPLNYRINEHVSIVPTLDFLLFMNDNSGNAANEGFKWRDSFLRVNYMGLVNTEIAGNKVTLDGNVRWYVPTSKAARDTDRIGSTRLYLNPAVQFGKSRWSFSGVNFAQQTFNKNETDAKGNALLAQQFYTGNQINYEISDKITAFVLHEAIINFNTKGISNASNPTASLSDVSPGVTFTLHERLQLTPALLWYTNQSIETTGMTLNANLRLL